MTKKTTSPVHRPDDLAAIDEELNAAMELVDLTNVKVTEILESPDISAVAATAGTVEPGDEETTAEDAAADSGETASKPEKSE